MLGAGECALGFEKFLGGAELVGVGEDKTNGRAEEGWADGDPGKGSLTKGNGGRHKENEEGDRGGEAVGDGESGEGGDGLADGSLAMARRCGGKENDGETGKEEKKIAPTGGTEGGLQGEEKICIGDDGEQKHDEKAEGKRAKARGSGVAGAKEEACGENCVTHDIEDQNLARQVRSAGKPLGRGIKEVKIGGDGDDGDLGKVEKAEPIPAAGFFVGGGEGQPENPGRPDEEEDVRGDRHVRGAGNKSLVIGGDGLGESFEEKSDGKEGPELASVSLRAASGVGGGKRRKPDHEEIEGVGI